MPEPQCKTSAYTENTNSKEVYFSDVVLVNGSVNQALTNGLIRVAPYDI